MTQYVEGVDALRRKLEKLKRTAAKGMADANRRNGEDLIRIARIVHVGEGATKADMKGTANADGSYLVDFGVKAKVTEGDRGPRPFVNPALKVTQKRRRGRQSRAISKAVKEAFSG